jgi:hypothetical protein
MKTRTWLFALSVLLRFAANAFHSAHAQTSWPAITLATPIDGFSQPVHVTHAGDGSGRIFVVELAGRVAVVKNGVRQSTPFLDIAPRVSDGMLSIAFPPGYGKKGKKSFYVNYVDTQRNVVIARYRVSSNPDIADAASEEIVLKVASPWPAANNPGGQHVGGELAFGPDGLLYVGIGDGGVGGLPEGDPFNLGQNPQSLRGKILRLDVEAKKPYRIPSSNPSVRTPGWRGEIWALGARNPWRSAFDRLTGDYYIGDVGENRYEEVNFQPAGSRGGENYGWKIMEGVACYVPSMGCNASGLTLPVLVYGHDPQAPISWCSGSITGGRVYRGAQTDLQGIYFFGDYCSGKIWGLRRNGGIWESAPIYDPASATPVMPALGLVSFGEDEAGNLYVTDMVNGLVYSVVQQ